MKTALIVGGASGIGLSIAVELSKSSKYSKVYVIDKKQMPEEFVYLPIFCEIFDLTSKDYSIFDKYLDVDTLMITAGFGKLALFENITEQHIVDSFDVNTIAPIRIIKKFYNRLLYSDSFECGIMVSIAGYMSSPFFAVYGATKAALRIFIESVNVELKKAGSQNRILNVSPGSIKGTAFYNGQTDLNQTTTLAQEIISHLQKGDDLFIPDYDTVFKNVLERYHSDFRMEGEHSYEYKLKSGRVSR